MNSPLRLVLLRPLSLLLFSLPVMAADPVVSNISAVQRAGTKLVDITYNVVADYPLSVALQISSDAGATFTVPAMTTSGAIGTGVAAGVGKLITWNAGTDWGGQVSATMRFKVTATDVIPPPAPAGFSLIPAGSYTMGDALDGNQNGDAPTRTVTVSAFYMAQNLVTKAEWDAVRTWGLANGYPDLVAGLGKASNHPVQTVSWYHMLKWCNARSQQGGFVPVYYTDDAQTTVYKTGDVNVTNAQVKWSANGYRLPTEAEWEKAARGGLSGKRFPWGDTISQSQANYYASSAYSYDLSGAVNNYHPSYTAGGQSYTSPVGSFAANGYGLYDMAGNVWQWCWDWYGSYDPAVLTDPRGPAASGTYRVFRGGSWFHFANYCRVAYRTYNNPSISYNFIGFRVARSSVQ
jgi:formylglycine-generating enzyme required for sulfatase activity